ncbi:MAG: DUF2784 family protein [Planctomycetaceae bacterium]|nr:DUF2784 family protein [Planctomycetaceae bacterium]
MSLQWLNIGFFTIHNALIVFNLLGWIRPETRRLHRLTVLATLFSWFVMGARYGWGYCLCTDLHFEVRRRMGIHAGETSYTELLLNQLPGVHVTRWTADIITVTALVAILIATVTVRIYDLRRAAKVAEQQECELESDRV